MRSSGLELVGGVYMQLSMEILCLGWTASLEASINHSFLTSYERPTKQQEEVIKALLSGKDVVVVLPTGSGKEDYAFCRVAFDI